MAWKQMKQVDHLVVHCSATPPDTDIGAEEIAQWHRGRGFLDIGYHFVIRRDGTIESGRPGLSQGAHVRGHNHASIGICLVGGVTKDKRPTFNYTGDQMNSLRGLLNDLLENHTEAQVVGHRDFAGVKKSCPCFNVKEWFYG